MASYQFAGGPDADHIHLFWWNSSERKGGGSPEDASVYYGDTLAKPIRSLSLKQVIIPHNIYNVCDNRNNLSTTGTWNSVAHTVAISEGNYTQAEILSSINTELGADGAITHDANTNKVTITGAGAGAVLDSAGSSLWLQLGFTADQLDQAAAASIAANGCPDLLPTHGLHICYDNARNIQPLMGFSRGALRDSIAYVPLNVPFGALFQYELPEPLHALALAHGSHAGGYVNSIKLTIRDDGGNIVDNQGSDWSALFEVVNV